MAGFTPLGRRAFQRTGKDFDSMTHHQIMALASPAAPGFLLEAENTTGSRSSNDFQIRKVRDIWCVQGLHTARISTGIVRFHHGGGG